MNKNRWRIASLLIFIALWLMGCDGASPTMPPYSVTPGNAGPAIVIIGSPDPAYALAQATIDSGQSQLLDLSRKATENSLNIAQAAKDAAQSTQDYNQRQKAALDYQATIISLNIAQAAATQQFLVKQTQIAGDATTAAQNRAATATQSAYLANVVQTAQAQAVLDAQVLKTDQAAAALTANSSTETMQAQLVLNAQATQTAQAIVNMTAYPLTATPYAVTQAALLMQQYGREQQSFMDQVVTPLAPFILTFVLLLFILGIILAYRRFASKPRPLRGYVNPNPLIVIDAAIRHPVSPWLPRIIPYKLTPANPPRSVDANTIHVEIVNASEAPVAYWIAEVEQQLDTPGEL